MSGVLLWTALAILVVMTATWLISLLLRDASIVDPVWGVGFVIAAWTAYVVADDPGGRGTLLALMVSIWGLRLFGYLLWRWRGHGEEDYRYQAMRRRHGSRFPLVSFLTVFVVQGILMWIVSLPVMATMEVRSWDLSWLSAAAVAVWGVGLFFETVGDLQLARFKSDPAHAGQVLDSGLWRYTRHPNYFGDFCVWWGHYLVAVSVGAWWTVVAPVVMSVLLMRVSGVGLLERTIGRRRPGYADYVERTNAFFPGPPRQG